MITFLIVLAIVFGFALTIGSIIIVMFMWAYDYRSLYVRILVTVGGLIFVSFLITLGVEAISAANEIQYCRGY